MPSPARDPLMLVCPRVVSDILDPLPHMAVTSFIDDPLSIIYITCKSSQILAKKGPLKFGCAFAIFTQLVNYCPNQPIRKPSTDHSYGMMVII